MIPGLFPLAKPLLDALDPETAHQLTIKALALAPHGAPPVDDPRLAVEAFGRRFPNPVGLAAGFDKQCEVPDALIALGFGFVELGGVVPKPQGGNPKPRVFRLPADRGVINRLGLNSEGIGAIRGVLVGADVDADDAGAPASSASTSAPTRTPRIAPPITSPASRRSPGSSTSSPSTSPRRTRRACATSRARRSSTISWGPAAPAPRSSSRSRPISPSRRSTRSSRRRSGAGSTASSSRIRRSRARRICASARSRKRAAGSRAGRCSGSRRPCWPRPLCALPARCR
jgi:hypothetical protein